MLCTKALPATSCVTYKGLTKRSTRLVSARCARVSRRRRQRNCPHRAMRSPRLTAAGGITTTASVHTRGKCAMKRSLSVLGLMLCLILPLHGKPPVVHAASDLVRLPGHVLPALTGTTPVSATPGADAEPLTLTLTLVLKREDQIG